MKLIITMEVDNELADPDHESGLTEEGHSELMEVLMEIGTNIEIQPYR